MSGLAKSDARSKASSDMGEALHDCPKRPAASLLDVVPRDAPALLQAQLISHYAVAAGFEWDTVDAVWEKVAEETEEFHAAKPGSPEREGELGDVLFTLVNVARKEHIDAEKALLGTCEKFRQRWAIMERCARDDMGCKIEDASRDELEALWNKAKAELAGACQQ